MTDMLTHWWERYNQQKRQDALKSYPFPYDGAAHVIMSNFFAVVGVVDERPYSDDRLSALVYWGRTAITDRFLELWPKKVATINEPTP